MRLIPFLIFSIFSLSLSAQNWKKIPNTEIKYSEFIHHNNDNWYEFEYEYFKLGDSLIAVHKSIKNEFFRLFMESPNALTEIFKETKAAINNTFKHLTDPHINRSEMEYKALLILTNIDVIDGQNELIWVVKYRKNELMMNSCVINISFQKIIDSAGKLNIQYLSTKYQYCEI